MTQAMYSRSSRYFISRASLAALSVPAVLASAVLCGVTGCSSAVDSEAKLSRSSTQPDAVQHMVRNVALRDGSVAVGGPIPAIQPLSELLKSAQALGFSPVDVMHEGHWLSIDTQNNTLRLMEGAKEVMRGEVQSDSSLRPGTFSLKHKQRSAPWYAPDEYFNSRGLSVPGEGEKGRFLRGALGEFALFLDKQTPLHSGPIASAELGGVKVDETVLSRVYYSLEIGAPIEVR